MIIDSDFDRQQFATNLAELREKAELSVETLANLVGVAPDLMEKWEDAELLPTVEQKVRLEKVFNWPLALPPRKVVPVKFGEWTKLVDERFSPFVREMLIAGFPTIFFGADNLSVIIFWQQSHRVEEFLNIVAPFEKGPETLYARVNPAVESSGRLPKWSCDMSVEDINRGEGKGPRRHNTANFKIRQEMHFPTPDLEVVIERLKAHNELTRVQEKATDSGSRRRKVWINAAPGQPKENLWATTIGPEAAFIENVPFMSNEVCWHDVVRLSPSGDVLEVLERLTTTMRATYDASSDRKEAEKQWKVIRAHFEPYGVICESAVPGAFAMAVPTTVSEEEMLKLYAKCPLKLSFPRRSTDQEQ